MNSPQAMDIPIRDSGTRLTGARLFGARALWLLFAALSVGYFIAGLGGYYAQMTHPTADNNALSSQAVTALGRAGITLTTYADVSIVVLCAVTLLSLAIAVALVLLRGDDWMALLMSLFIISYVTANIGVPTGPLAAQGSSLNAALDVFGFAASFAIPFAALLLFPNGRFAPRWSWSFLAAATIWATLLSAIPNLLDGDLFLGYPLFFAGVIAFMVYRYQRVFTAVQRLQTKWVVAGLVTTLLVNQIFWIPTGFTPLGETIYPPFAFMAYQIAMSLLPITLFIAIQRYHLYNIDTIFNRALVYGSLTVILAALFFGLIYGTQTLLHHINPTAEQSPLVIVLSTLLIAALVQPLRNRLQAVIDRRFYRSKYDARRTLEAFSATLRNEVELGDLSANLLAVVEETMQPERVSLWLRSTPEESVEVRPPTRR